MRKYDKCVGNMSNAGASHIIINVGNLVIKEIFMKILSLLFIKEYIEYRVQ